MIRIRNNQIEIPVEGKKTIVLSQIYPGGLYQVMDYPDKLPCSMTKLLGGKECCSRSREFINKSLGGWNTIWYVKPECMEQVAKNIINHGMVGVWIAKRAYLVNQEGEENNE